MNIDLNSILLFCLNLIGAGIWWRLNLIDRMIYEVKDTSRETRDKLDDHCEDFALHVIPNRRTTDLS